MELELEAWMRVERWILKHQAALFTVRTMTNIYQRLVSLRARVGYHKQKVGRLRHIHTFLLLATGMIHGNRIPTSPFIRLSTIFPSFLPSPFPPSPSLILPLFLASYTAVQQFSSPSGHPDTESTCARAPPPHASTGMPRLGPLASRSQTKRHIERGSEGVDTKS